MILSEKVRALATALDDLVMSLRLDFDDCQPALDLGEAIGGLYEVLKEAVHFQRSQMQTLVPCLRKLEAALGEAHRTLNDPHPDFATLENAVVGLTQRLAFMTGADDLQT